MALYEHTTISLIQIKFSLFAIGISALTNVKVNPYHQPSTFTCTVQGDPLPEEDSVHLYQVSGDRLNSTSILRNSSSVGNSGRSVLFTVRSVVPGAYYQCGLQPYSSAHLRALSKTYGKFFIKHTLEQNL